MRALEEDELSERLNSLDSNVRLMAAAAIKCFLVLITQATREGPFQREVRRLKIMQTISRIYGEGMNGKDGRHKVQHFLKRRMPKLYPTMPSAERSALKEESQEMIDKLEGGGEKEEEEPRDSTKRVYRV